MASNLFGAHLGCSSTFYVKYQQNEKSIKKHTASANELIAFASIVLHRFEAEANLERLSSAVRLYFICGNTSTS